MFKRYQSKATPPPPQPEPRREAKTSAPPRASLKMAAAAPETDEQEDRRRRRLLNLRVTIHQRVLETLNLAAIDGAPKADLRQEVAAISREVLKELGVVVNAQEFEHLVNALIDEVTGLGPLEPLLKDPSITDILFNTHE